MSGSLEQRLRARLGELKGEFEKGQHKLEELEAEAGRLRQTLLRISGAAQVLEEELNKAESASLAEAGHDGKA